MFGDTLYIFFVLARVPARNFMHPNMLRQGPQMLMSATRGKKTKIGFNLEENVYIKQPDGKINLLESPESV